MGIGGKSRQEYLDYDGFVDKFKPKKTTDDCLTPPKVYDCVLSYVVERYGIDPERVVRPFWPGADYEAADYPDGCTVVDNPPFSKLAAIQRFYLAHGVPFFLFAPSLTAFSSWDERVNHVVCSCNVTYENGAVVRTSFLTNLGDGGVVAESCPELTERVNAVCDEIARRKAVPRYEYPDEVLTAARLMFMASYGTRLEVRRGECVRVACLDSQREAGKSGIYGGGLLLRQSATARRVTAEQEAAERAATEKPIAHKWGLSAREHAMIALMD